jgi:uncharacterized glyoxalase superfamily protein PhnB
MILVQSRFVTDDVVALAEFYARLVGAETTLNDYYVEVRAGGASVAFSKSRFTEFTCPSANSEVRVPVSGEVILDFKVEDVDAEFLRIDQVGVEWVMKPTMQPWGARAMTFRDPQGNLVNVFSPSEGFET